MKILLLGKNGQIGWELQRTLAPLCEVIALGREELDLLDEKGIRSTVRSIKPNVIVNAAAYNAVDKAEDEQDFAMAINATAPGILAEEAVLSKASVVHYSTDYIFDGNKNMPYKEDDTPNPLNIYGKSKLAGEKAIRETEVPYLIFRTSWAYGLRGNNFLLTILRLAQERDELRIVADQYGIPNWCRMIAETTTYVIAAGLKDIFSYFAVNKGIYNLSSSGETTWYHFAAKILQSTSASTHKCRHVSPIASDEYKAPARRPLYSVLDNSKLLHQFGLNLPSWERSLDFVLSDYSNLPYILAGVKNAYTTDKKL